MGERVGVASPPSPAQPASEERVMPTHSTTPTAYSYIRFSTPEQAKGDSLRRQSDLAEAYCRRRGWTLDTSLTLRDLGVSAFRGDNALSGNLRTFLDAIRRGT